MYHAVSGILFVVYQVNMLAGQPTYHIISIYFYNIRKKYYIYIAKATLVYINNIDYYYFGIKRKRN